MRRAVVTGSSGQVGGALVERLRRSGWEVREFDVKDGGDLLDAFVHVDDVIDAAQRAIEIDNVGHHRLILCGPGHFDTKPARRLLGWKPHRDWPG